MTTVEMAKELIKVEKQIAKVSAIQDKLTERRAELLAALAPGR